MFRQVDGKAVCDHCGRVLTPVIDLPPAVQLTSTDGDFDLIASLARMVVKAPTALVSLVDQTHQVFAGADGLPDDSVREQPLAASMCQLVVMSRSPLVLDDVTSEPMVEAQCDANDLAIGAYVGYPIFDLNGAAVGTVCALDEHSRVWTDEEKSALEGFALLATAQVRARGMALGVQDVLEKMEEYRDSSGTE